MSARKTALVLGYKSLYDYAARRLNLSEGAVPARIHVANVSRSTRRIRRRSSSGGERSRKQPLGHLVHNEMAKKTSRPSRDTLRRKFPRGFTNVMAISACILGGTARVGLHLDHRSPFAIFRNNDEEVMTLLCHAHNLLMAERVYGVDFIQQKIAERRKARSP